MMTSHHGYLLVWYAAALHLAQAGALAFDPRAGWATSLAGVVAWSGAWSPLAIAIASIATVLACLWRRESRDPTIRFARFLMLVPQQFLLTLAAYSAGAAILAGQYADFVPRPHAFIFADQIGYPLIATFHTLAIFAIVFGRGR